MKKFIASQLLSDTDWQKFITSNYDLLPEHSGSHDKSDVTSAAMLHDAIIEGMDKEKAEISTITNNTDAPNFDNTIVALTQSGGMLERATTTMYNLLSAETNDELDELANEMAQKLSDHENDIMLNEQLFTRVKRSMTMNAISWTVKTANCLTKHTKHLNDQEPHLMTRRKQRFATSHVSCLNTH